MQLQDLHLHHIRIPLRINFEQANQRTQLSNSVILRLETRDGVIGYGECGPRPYVTGESPHSVIQTLQALAPALTSRRWNSVEDIAEQSLSLLDQGTAPAAVCALELALLDALAKTKQQTMADLLEITQPRTLQYSGVLPFGKWSTLAPIARQFNFAAWKFKAVADCRKNLTTIWQIKSLWPVGEEGEIRLDANGGWNLAQAHANIKDALRQGVRSFEQPLATDKMSDWHQLTEAYGAKASIMADEALVSYQDAKKWIKAGACNHFNLKVSKNGGIFNMFRIYNLAQQHGIPCQLGAQYGETSILTAAGSLFAQQAPVLTALEGALGTHLLQDDIVNETLMLDQNGQLAPPQQQITGWPLEINDQKLQQYTVEQKTISL